MSQSNMSIINIKKRIITGTKVKIIIQHEVRMDEYIGGDKSK